MTIITAPDGYDAAVKAESASHMLRYLLTAYPNTVVGHRDVCDALGYEVGASAVSNAAHRLRRGGLGLNIASRGGRGGGYVLMAPVPAMTADSCGACHYRTLIGTCKRLKGRPVEIGQWCYGYRP